jgi:hypothetical protein
MESVGTMKLAKLLGIFVFFLACPVLGGNEGCIQCHTEDAILESLVSAPKTEAPSGVGPAGPPAATTPKTYYKRYLIDKNLLDKDPHFMNGCSSCHKGDDKSTDQDKAHKGIVSRPSVDLKTCSDCHGDISGAYQSASHYTMQEALNKVSRRFSKKEEGFFAEKIFEMSCKSCHASCGDCHVRSPARDGLSSGFVKGHGFVKKDEGRTCAVCHGGRVYPEYTGKYGGSPDVHFRKGMTCVDCHKKAHLHSGIVSIRGQVAADKNRPRCIDCHKIGKESGALSKLAHARHEGKVSCYGCHSQGEYTNCYSCHIGKGSTSRLGFMLGADPNDKKVLTTLRAVPIVRETFLGAGIKMEHFDEVPDYRGTAVHNISRSTERTRSCDTCHLHSKGFLSKGSLIKNGSKANEDLIFRMRPLTFH